MREKEYVHASSVYNIDVFPHKTHPHNDNDFFTSVLIGQEINGKLGFSKYISYYSNRHIQIPHTHTYIHNVHVCMHTELKYKYMHSCPLWIQFHMLTYTTTTTVSHDTHTHTTVYVTVLSSYFKQNRQKHKKWTRGRFINLVSQRERGCSIKNVHQLQMWYCV